MIVMVSPVFIATSAVAALTYLALALGRRGLGHAVARALFALAWASHAASLLSFWITEPGRFGFSIALSAMAWMVSTLYAIESRIYPQLHARWELTSLGAAAVILSMILPGQIHTQLASPWLTLHWVIGFVAYAAIAAAVLHGWLMLRAEAAMRSAATSDTGLPLLALERLTFRFLAVGVALLTLTLVVGIGFSKAWFGVHLRWDHKTILSIVAWAILTRLWVLRRWRGIRGRAAVMQLYAGAVVLLLSYVGSRFVSEVLLQHAS